MPYYSAKQGFAAKHEFPAGLGLLAFASSPFTIDPYPCFYLAAPAVGPFTPKGPFSRP